MAAALATNVHRWLSRSSERQYRYPAPAVAPAAASATTGPRLAAWYAGGAARLAVGGGRQRWPAVASAMHRAGLMPIDLMAGITWRDSPAPAPARVVAALRPPQANCANCACGRRRGTQGCRQGAAKATAGQPARLRSNSTQRGREHDAGGVSRCNTQEHGNKMGREVTVSGVQAVHASDEFEL